MGLTFVDPDLEQRTVKEADAILNGPRDTDPVLVTGDIGYEKLWEPKQSHKPKSEISEKLKTARKKAQQARLIMYNHRRKDPTLPDYKFGAYVYYFLLCPNREPQDMLRIIREQQREKLVVSSQSQQYHQEKVGY